MTENNTQSEKTTYSAPHLLDYGPVSELTQALPGDAGFDGGPFPSSYSAST